jgi:hypothetical protein
MGTRKVTYGTAAEAEGPSPCPETQNARPGPSRGGLAGSLTMRPGPTDGSRMLFWFGPSGPAGEALFAEAERNARLAAERIERNPWTHEYRRVKAEVERTGDASLFADF